MTKILEDSPLDPDEYAKQKKHAVSVVNISMRANENGKSIHFYSDQFLIKNMCDNHPSFVEPLLRYLLDYQHKIMSYTEGKDVSTIPS